MEVRRHKKPPVDEVGKPCRHCQTAVIEGRHDKPPKPTKSGYYYERWLKCPNRKCRAIYLLEDEKRWFGQPDVTPKKRFMGWFGDTLET